jgi:hypothetical protein
MRVVDPDFINDYFFCLKLIFIVIDLKAKMENILRYNGTFGISILMVFVSSIHI